MEVRLPKIHKANTFLKININTDGISLEQPIRCPFYITLSI